MNQIQRCQQSAIGKELYGKFVKERIQSCKYSIWSPIKKNARLTWKSTGKTLRVVAKDNMIELQEDRAYFVRMMMVCKARPEIDIKEAVGEYEFSIVPRSMFAADGTMLHCSSKNTLMNILEKIDPRRNTEGSTEEVLPVVTGMAATQKVSIVDAMAEVQALDKPDWIKSCSQLAEHFTMYVFENYNDCDELRLIFDRLVIYKFNIFFIFLDNQQPYSIQKVVSVEKQLMFYFR